MNSTSVSLIIFIVIFAAGSILIEVRNATRLGSKPVIERRKTQRVEKLEPLGQDVLDGAMNLVDENKLKTREGMRFIIKVMQEVYKSDLERTAKVNEVVEQFETLRSKSLMVFAEKYPKLSLFMILLIFAWITDEIRGPIIRAIFASVHISLP